MAAAEVTVSSGDLMTVKEEEAESSGNNHKTQVILHLQPILHEINDDIADSGTTVLAIETHHDGKAEGEEIEYGYPITCGDSKAVLLFKKFVCPGINVRCVKFDDQLISPKQFVHLAGKATLKDWKRAIRLGGVMLRKMMDSGQIDFYQHDTVCSNTCRSTKFDVLINSTRLPLGTAVQPSLTCLALDLVGGQGPPLTVISAEAVHEAAEVKELAEEKFSATAKMSPCPARDVNQTTANGHAAKRKRADTPDEVLGLWRGVADAGLMGEVLSSLQTDLLATLRGVEVRSEKANLQENDAIILNSLCKMFGLLDSVKQALDLKHPVKTKTVTQPLSAAPHAQLTINPQLFNYFPASTGQRHHAEAVRMDRDGHDTTLERECELGKLGQEGVEGEHPSGVHKKPAQRTVKYQDPHLRSEDLEEKEGLCDIQKVVIGRKSSKKHKSK
ncbi:hypothetical protein PBY51_017896 [Eleginops maclovinus]|nr:hypothetical protein PBY51_017896 [Eleginops maclovinus]